MLARLKACNPRILAAAGQKFKGVTGPAVGPTGRGWLTVVGGLDELKTSFLARSTLWRGRQIVEQAFGRLLYSLKNINLGDPDPYRSLISTPYRPPQSYAQARGFSNVRPLFVHRRVGSATWRK